MKRDSGATREVLLEAAIPVIGQFGLKKTSVNDLARAAGLSKQGLYLHFASKEELYVAAMERYFDEGLRLTDEALAHPTRSFEDRVVGALDAWFGRHLEHFNPASLEIVEPRRSTPSKVDDVKTKYMGLLERAIAGAPEYAAAEHTCSPAELSRVLFQYGLTWKEGHASREAFRETLRLCVRACFPPDRRRSRSRARRAR